MGASSVGAGSDAERKDGEMGQVGLVELEHVASTIVGYMPPLMKSGISTDAPPRALPRPCGCGSESASGVARVAPY